MKLTNLTAPLLAKYRYRNKADPFDLFNTLKVNNHTFKKLNKNVLILPIRVAPVSNLFEGVYGYALKLRGYNVHGLFCGQAIKKCDNMSFSRDNPLHCSLCNYEQNRFVKTFGFVKHNYDMLVDPDKKMYLLKLINDIEVEKLFTLRYDNVLLGHQIQMATIKYLLTSTVDFKKEEKLIKEFAFSTLMSYEATKQLIIETSPEFVLVSHGVYSTWGGAIEACKKLKIRTIVWGRGYVKGNIIADFNDSYIFECANENNQNWENITLSKNEKTNIHEYFVNKKNPIKTDDYVNYYDNNENVSFQNYSFLKKNNRIKFALFPNIPWDGTTFSASKEFPSIKIFMQKTLHWFFEHPEYDLIIRAHPAEIADKYNVTQETIKDIIDEIMPNLPSNIIFIKPDDRLRSYEVADACDVVLLFASTMGLEMAYFGKTVIQTGQSMISNKGFVFEAKTESEYYALLDKAITHKLVMSNEMKERVEKYAYHWIFKRHIPETTYKHKGLTFTEYNIKSSLDLAPGKNKVVDWFIDRCEDGKPFIWEG